MKTGLKSEWLLKNSELVVLPSGKIGVRKVKNTRKGSVKRNGTRLKRSQKSPSVVSSSGQEQISPLRQALIRMAVLNPTFLISLQRIVQLDKLYLPEFQALIEHWDRYQKERLLRLPLAVDSENPALLARCRKVLGLMAEKSSIFLPKCPATISCTSSFLSRVISRLKSLFQKNLSARKEKALNIMNKSLISYQ